VARYAAFLRGMNIGGRRISNAELAAAVTALGFDDVATFRASGNVAFSVSRAASDSALARTIEAGLAQALGYPVPTFVRSAAEAVEIAAGRPFPPQALRASEGKLHVAMLRELPAAGVRSQVLGLATAADRLAFGARELYWLPRGRMLDSGLDLQQLERLVGPWTMRTKATIEQLAARHLAA
jgi:uncharacterized protein (DUF1697 family)